MSDKFNEEVIIDSLFNSDLCIDEVTIFNFTTKLEFEFTGLFRKISKLTDENDKINSDFVFDKIPFELCERVANWMDKNTNITEKLYEGDIMDKTIVFISLYLDYIEYKKKLKK